MIVNINERGYGVKLSILHIDDYDVANETDETGDLCTFATALHKKTENIAKINNRQNAPYFLIE